MIYLLPNIECLVASSMSAAALPGVISTPAAFTATATFHVAYRVVSR